MPTIVPGRTRLSALILIPLLALVNTATPILAVDTASQQAAFKTISVDQLADALRQKDFVLINVHIPYAGEIEQTDLFIPFDQIADRLADLPSDKSASIVLYCLSGRMSNIAATTLAGLGYSNVTDVSGGMNSWTDKGFALLRR